MVSKKDKERMLEYLEDKLKFQGTTVGIGKKDILGQLCPDWVGAIESHYLKLTSLAADGSSKQNLVFCFDQKYTGEKLEALYRATLKKYPNFGVVFFKDGKTFFRNAAAHHDFKRKYKLSLKKYAVEQTHHMITLSPEERIVRDRNDSRVICRDGKYYQGSPVVQYYQPPSAELEEGLESFVFGRVEFDYSHVDSDRFQPANTYSERIFIWKNRLHHAGALTVQDGLLVPRYS